MAALIAAVLGARLTAAPGEFSVGVLRRDGVLIPFASYNGRTWEVVWPGSDLRQPLPINLSDVPSRWWGGAGAQAPWHAWVGDESSQPLKLVKPVQVPIFCGAHLAITTDYHGELPAERAPTVPKDGIATAGNVTVLPITQVSVRAPDAARMVAAITERFNEEERLAERMFTNWSHPYNPRRRAAVPITLEAFYRSTDTSPAGDVEFRTNYIEAVRRFPAGYGEEGCGLITFARGWVTEYRDRKPEINLGARITYCDRNDVSFIQPFGRIRVERGGGGRGADVYWIYQSSSWRDEFYSVARVMPEGVRPVLVVAGGGCPKERAK